jgi:hypothetical protein
MRRFLTACACLLFGHHWGRLWEERVMTLDDHGRPETLPRWQEYRQCKRCGKVVGA